MKVAGVLVNYRTAELTAQAIAALLGELAALGPHHVYVVDNDSQDGSLETLRREAAERGFGDRVTLIAAPRNGGYGYGINLAIDRALSDVQRPEYLYVINTDAVPDPDSLARLCAFMDAHPDAGIAGSCIHGPDGTVQGAGFRFPSLWSELDETLALGLLSRALHRYVVAIPPAREHREVDWVPGTSMLIRTRAIEQVGRFDEGFFLYFEETDFCRRLRRRGWKSYYVADAPITHIGCVSTGMLDKSRRMPRYWLASRHRYFLKHHGRAYAAACDAAWVAGYVMGHGKRALQGRSTQRRPHMLRDFVLAGARDLIAMRRPAPDEAQVEPKPSDGHGTADARSADELELLDLLAEDFATYGRNPLEPGLWSVVTHRVGRRSARLSSRPARVAAEATYQVMSTAVDWVWGIHVPRSVELGRRVRIWHNGCIVLNARSIGNDVHIRHDTTFGPVRDGQSGLPVIEDRADIGSGACVLGDVTLGHDATVGANSVVLKDVPPRAMVLGVPARIVPR
jgi:N-acetylglucosaminyl-diphospho-decaprenol L-rhamnosyltransferase